MTARSDAAAWAAKRHELRRLLTADPEATRKAVAARLGASPAWVSRAATALGLAACTHPRDADSVARYRARRIADAERVRDDGGTYADLGRQWQVSRQAAFLWLRRHAPAVMWGR